MVKMRDIAADLQISPTTVCYALGENWQAKGVAPKTRQAVLKRSRELGYRRNRIAASLVKRATYTIGVIAPVMDTLYGDMLQGIESIVGDEYALLVGISQYREDRERKLLESFEERMVDGLIIVNAAHPENSAVLKRLSKAGLPIVQADRHFEDLEIDTVEPDGAGLTSMLTNHLLELGHRAIAFLSSYHVHVGTRSRQRGYEQAMAARGLKTQVWSPRTADRGKIWKGTSYGYSRSLVALREEPIPTAVVAHDVGGALGCVRAMQSLGLECPRDISVVGVERELDHDHENPLMRLQLTQAVWSVQEMGRRAARMLIDRLRTTGESRPAPRHELIGGRLQLGGSAVPPGHTSMKLEATRGS